MSPNGHTGLGVFNLSLAFLGRGILEGTAWQALRTTLSALSTRLRRWAFLVVIRSVQNHTQVEV